MTRDLLIIFTRNPELGKCKTRLAAVIGDKAALDIYTFLLKHTVDITMNLKMEIQVHYSETIHENDLWDTAIYDKKKQEGEDLGARMQYAFMKGFEAGFKRIVIIGSDMYDLDQTDIEKAFSTLNNHNFAIGPAKDGGYYLLGMKELNYDIFRNKKWGTATVLADTLKDLRNDSLAILKERNDIDVYEDIKDIEIFKNFIN